MRIKVIFNDQCTVLIPPKYFVEVFGCLILHRIV